MSRHGKTGKYLITGWTGCGKLTIIDELKTRGFSAYNIVAIPGLTRLEDQQTNKNVTG